jgi:nitric oxide reductase activation protein
MGGQKWNKTMTAVTAICKAASMVSNLDVVVDIRTTTFGSSIGDKPLIAIAYDSRVDKFEKIHRVFPRLRPVGTTPEGLCFEAILKTMVADKAKDQYFINFSDGEPYFETRNFSYHGYVAFRHTKKQVEILRDRGIKILSFFITEHETESLSYGFKEMYGADARNINVTNLLPLAKEINSMFV